MCTKYILNINLKPTKTEAHINLITQKCLACWKKVMIEKKF